MCVIPPFDNSQHIISLINFQLKKVQKPGFECRKKAENDFCLQFFLKLLNYK